MSRLIVIITKFSLFPFFQFLIAVLNELVILMTRNICLLTMKAHGPLHVDDLYSHRFTLSSNLRLLGQFSSQAPLDAQEM